MKDINPYLKLKMEFPGIKDIITQYSRGGIIGHYLSGMESALQSDSITEVLYYLEKICKWYQKNLGTIQTNAFVYNESEHVEAQKMLDELCQQLQEFDFSAVVEKRERKNSGGNNVFVVHGHDTEAKITVARMLEQLGLNAIILHEQPDKGRTIIEKIESYTAVAYAIVIYTECDLGRAKEDPEDKNQARARQNVVFEHGVFIGSLGRDRVCALVKGHIEKPGDIDGVVYINMDDAGAWKMQLCKNMKAVGIDVDMNKLL